MALDCGHAPTPTPCTTGYGQDQQGKTFCFPCAAYLDRGMMVETGHATLYLVATSGAWPYKVTNWPGSLEFPVFRIRRSVGRGFGGTYPVVTVNFVGPDGFVWSGRNAGDSQILRAKRTRQRAQRTQREPS